MTNVLMQVPAGITSVELKDGSIPTISASGQITVNTNFTADLLNAGFTLVPTYGTLLFNIYTQSGMAAHRFCLL